MAIDENKWYYVMVIPSCGHSEKKFCENYFLNIALQFSTSREVASTGLRSRLVPLAPGAPIRASFGTARDAVATGLT